MEFESKLDQIAAFSDKTFSQLSQIRESLKKLSEKLSSSLRNTPSEITGKSEWVTLSYMPEEGICEMARLVFRQERGLLIELCSSEDYSEIGTFYSPDKITNERLAEIASKDAFKDSFNQILEDIAGNLKSASNDFELIHELLSKTLDSDLDLIEQNLEQANQKVGYEKVYLDFRNARLEIDDKPEESLTLARSLLESLFKHYSSNHQKAYSVNENISKQVKEIMRSLSFDGDNDTDRQLKSIIGSLSNLVNEIGSLRNDKGSAHGRDQNHIPIGSSEARLAVSSAGIVAAYLLSKISESQNSSENNG